MKFLLTFSLVVLLFSFNCNGKTNGCPDELINLYDLFQIKIINLRKTLILWPAVVENIEKGKVKLQNNECILAKNYLIEAESILEQNRRQLEYLPHIPPYAE